MRFWKRHSKVGREERAIDACRVESMLRATIEGAPELIAVEDVDARYLAFNKAYHDEFQKVFGVDLAIGDSMLDVLADLPEEQQKAAQLFERTMRGENFTITREFGDERRERRFYEIHCFPLYDENGRVSGGSHIARDVTEIRRAQEALRITEQNHLNIIMNSPGCLKLLDREGRVLSINMAGKRLIELETEDQYVNRMWLDTWDDDARERAQAALETAMAGEVGRFRAPGVTLKGKVKWWDETLIPIEGVAGRPERILVIAQDITGQIEAQDELQRSEDEFRKFFESASGGKVQADPETGRLLRVNELFSKMTGFSQEELLGMTISEIVHPDDRERNMEMYLRTRDGEMDEYSMEKRYLRKDGSVIWVQTTTSFLRNPDGKAYRAFFVIQDISELKKVERQLQDAVTETEESRRLLGALMEYVPEGIAIADLPDFKIRMMSRYGRDICGGCDTMTAMEMAASGRLLNPDSMTPISFDELPLVRAIRENKVLNGVELVYVSGDGDSKWQLANAAPIHDAAGRVTGGIVSWHDVSERKKTEEVLEGERGFLRQVINAAPSMIFVKDWDGRFVLGNDALAACYGTTPEAMVGRTDADFNPNVDELEHFVQDDREVMSTRRPKIIPEEKVTSAGGEIHWFSTIKVPLVNHDGSCHQLLGVATDITLRKQAETALKRFRIALDSAADNIFLVDPQTMRFLDVSQSACRDLGYSREELLRLGPADIMPSISQQELHTVFEEARSDPAGKGVLETTHYRKDCSGFQVEVTLRPVEDQGRLIVVAVARDISERKQAEMNLMKANERLAEADRRKDEFLAMLAHELRNPLAPIRNAAQVLRLTASQDPVLQRQRDIIDRQVSHMARLLDDLLDVSRITHGNINLRKQEVRLADVFARAMESANPLIEARRHTLTLIPPPENLRVFGDFDRLIQIVGNLLSNSAKYTENGGRIWLEAERVGGEAIIRVRDSGVGIAPEMLPRIFDVFTQVDRSLDRSQGGLGLGLTLVRNLAEMHGGRIEAHSEGLGRGSEFIVHLPALPEKESDASPGESGQGRGETRRHRILVVDDVADTANSLAELLTLFGHEVVTAYDGSSVISLARDFHPDVILLDIGLPGENGYQVARRVRQDPILKGVTLVALTGYGQEEDRRLAEEAGFDHLFTKPVEVGALQEVLV